MFKFPTIPPLQKKRQLDSDCMVKDAVSMSAVVGEKLLSLIKDEAVVPYPTSTAQKPQLRTGPFVTWQSTEWLVDHNEMDKVTTDPISSSSSPPCVAAILQAFQLHNPLQTYKLRICSAGDNCFVDINFQSGVGVLHYSYGLAHTTLQEAFPLPQSLQASSSCATVQTLRLRLAVTEVCFL
jgi:hypothetical protein